MRPCNTRLLALLGLLLLAGCDQILLPPKPTPTPSVRLTEFPVPTHYPSNGLGGITVGPDGTLWFTEGDGNRIGRITPTGLITEFRVPAAGELTAWPDGKLWFTWNAPQVGRLTPAGVVTTFLLPRSSNEAAGITAGPDGTLWFTELFANKLGCITPGGRLTEFPLPAPFTAPSAITVGADHRLWFLAAQNQSAITSRELLVRFTLSH